MSKRWYADLPLFTELLRRSVLGIPVDRDTEGLKTGFWVLRESGPLSTTVGQTDFRDRRPNMSEKEFQELLLALLAVKTGPFDEELQVEAQGSLLQAASTFKEAGVTDHE
jgi:hypothetical protein